MAKRRARAKTVARGYGARHRRLRRELEPLVAAGLVRCARCGEQIAAGEPFDLGHDDLDRTRYRGAEHVACNRATKHGRIASREW